MSVAFAPIVLVHSYEFVLIASIRDANTLVFSLAGEPLNHFTIRRNKFPSLVIALHRRRLSNALRANERLADNTIESVSQWLLGEQMQYWTTNHGRGIAKRYSLGIARWCGL